MSNAESSRRGFLTFLADLLMAVIALIVAIPALGYVLAPLRRKPETSDGTTSFLDAGAIANFPAGQWRLGTLEMVQEDGWKKTRVRHSVWILRASLIASTLGEKSQGITVLSTICPHLGCPINWHPDQSQFVCPCHGGVFSSEGRHVSGPPPRNMDSLEFEVREGRLWVRWQDFKIGVAERVPVSV
jgi:menaquinol-cytochrome c reductase iron-sulfur subunit